MIAHKARPHFFIVSPDIFDILCLFQYLIFELATLLNLKVVPAHQGECTSRISLQRVIIKINFGKSQTSAIIDGDGVLTLGFLKATVFLQWNVMVWAALHKGMIDSFNNI